MPKAKYHFNTHSLKYEKVVISFKKRFLRVLGWCTTAAVFSSVIIAIAYEFLDSPKERQLKREISLMQFQYDLLQQRIDRTDKVLNQLQEHDDNIYRVIFEAEPIPASVRQAGYGGIDKYRTLEGFNNSELLVATTKRIDKLEKQLYVQSKSFDEVFELAKNKQVLLASIPAIQPVSNKELTRVASGFGYRIHPIYKTRIMHTGIDFTATVGTDIYSTGNGTVAKVEYDGRGYGNNVVINHGYGYSTLYGHMSKILVKQGQKIKRGDVIGHVGNTGSSTGPHLHYEVIRNNQKINPVNYFYNDLTAEQYEKMIELASKENQSFD